MNLKQLISGSDIRGIATKTSGHEINLTDNAISSIAAAFEKYITKKLSKTNINISIGNDSRISADRIKRAFISGLKNSDVSDLGLITTPAMFMSTVTFPYNFDAAVMITASHHPFDRNGLKFFTKDGGLEHSEIEEIISMAKDVIPIYKEPKKLDFLPIYAKILVDKITSATKKELPLKGYKIIVDAGNGASGYFANDVLKVLGADIQGSQFLDPDGMFPNHIPNPENADAMNSIKQAVLKEKADFGVIFDTDGDRAGAVDSFGTEINRNRLIALISSIILHNNSGAYIVTDSVTSDGLNEFITNHGGVHHRFKRGYKNVINEMIRLNESGKNCLLAMETSGHGALSENYNLDDGAYLITKILIGLSLNGKSIFDELSTLKEPAESLEIRLAINCENFADYGNNVISYLEKILVKYDFKAASDNFEGIRAFDDTGWFLLRLSVHDPIMPLNIETASKGSAKIIADKLLAILSQFDKLDLSAFDNNLMLFNNNI